GINWEDFKIKFLFAAEGFSEKWRDHMLSSIGASDPLTNAINIYGSADAAILAHETPLAIAIRRQIADQAEAMRMVFSDTRLPTLAQYDPHLKYFEAENTNLLI